MQISGQCPRAQPRSRLNLTGQPYPCLLVNKVTSRIRRKPPSRVRARLVGAIGGFSVLRDAVAITPRPDGDAVPNSPRRMFRFQLGVMISPFRDFRLVERQTVSNQPIPEVGTIDGTRGNRGSAATLIDGRTYDGTICYERLKLVRRLYPTLIVDVIRPSAKLAGFRRVDAKQVDSDALNSECVAVDDAGLSRDTIGACRGRAERCSQP